MRRSMLNRFGFLCFVFLLIVGCGSDPKKNEADALPGQKDVIADVKALLDEAKNTNKKPPATKAEFLTYDATNPVATGGLGRGVVIYIFGQGLTGGTNIIAYDAQAEKEGGYVLLQDGTIKKMTADEFKSAPKAGKK